LNISAHYFKKWKVISFCHVTVYERYIIHNRAEDGSLLSSVLELGRWNEEGAEILVKVMTNTAANSCTFLRNVRKQLENYCN